MKLPEISATAWKWLISLLALFVASLVLTQIWYAPRTLAPGAAGTLGMQYHEVTEWGPARYVIDELAADSPLLAAGAKVGDIWYPERYYDAWRGLQANEPIGLTLVNEGSTRQLTVMTLSDPVYRSIAYYWLGWIDSLFCLLVGLVIGFRQSKGVGFRAMSFAFILIPVVLLHAHPGAFPAGAFLLIQELFYSATSAASAALFTVSAFNFPDDQPRSTPLKCWLLRYVVPAYALLWLVTTGDYLLHSTGYYAPGFSRLGRAYVLFALSIGFIVMWSNWRSSQGDLRQRQLWILLSFAAITVLGAVASVLSSESSVKVGGPTTFWSFRMGLLLSVLTFSYAILRHRVIPIGFAVNRAVVYGAASTGLLLSFGIIEWAAHHLLAAFGHEMPLVLNLLIAIGVFLIFHRVRHAGENLIERLFFHAWHVREQGLRKFVQQAPFITRSEPLASALAEALRQFTEGAGQALYRRVASGNYERMATTLNDAPAQVDADDPLLVALRAEQQPTFCSDTASMLPGELAVPSIHHGQLDGFVLLGSKPNGDTYRPDEREALGYMAHQVGLDFRALRMEELELEVSDLHTRQAEAQSLIGALQSNLTDLRHTTTPR